MQIFAHALVKKEILFLNRFIRLSEYDGFFLFISQPSISSLPLQPLNRIPYFMLQSMDRRSLFLIKKKLGFGRVIGALTSPQKGGAYNSRRKGVPLYRFVVASRFGVLKLIHLFAGKFISKKGCLRLAK
jgi:hypothetical protein